MEFEFLVWEYKYTPSGFPRLARQDNSTKALLLGDGILECESKGGSAGSEDLQCQQPGRFDSIIQNFKGVSKIESKDVTRYLQEEGEMDTRSLSEWGTTLQINCVQSDVEVRQ